MSIENLIYNCSGTEYWEKIYQDDYQRLCLHEGHHGKYVGEIIDNEIFNSNTGDYLGEIFEERLIVDMSKIGKVKIKGNFMFHPTSRMGHACIPKVSKLEIPSGYEDFTAGIK
jgi:hypothetical protein